MPVDKPKPGESREDVDLAECLDSDCDKFVKANILGEFAVCLLWMPAFTEPE